LHLPLADHQQLQAQPHAMPGLLKATQTAQIPTRLQADNIHQPRQHEEYRLPDRLR